MKTKITYLIAFLLSAFNVNAQTEVTFYTTMGTFVATMEQAKRPITTNNFMNLVNNKFYDGIIFHRVINGFMIQGGDPTGTGYGGSGVTIPDELTPVVSNLQKTISMANSGPNTGTSQFFINLVDNTYLNPNYPCFGIVNTGFSVVQAIGVVPTNSSDRPLTDVVMDSVRITQYPTSTSNYNQASFALEIFPNPIVNESILAIQSPSSEEVTVTVINTVGLPICKKTFHLNKGVNEISFNELSLDRVSSGLYYIGVTNGKTMSEMKTVRVQ